MHILTQSAPRSKPISTATRLQTPLLKIFATVIFCTLAFFLFLNHKPHPAPFPALGRWKDIHDMLHIPLPSPITKASLPHREEPFKKLNWDEIPRLRIDPQARLAKSFRETPSTKDEMLSELARLYSDVV